jgi:alkaline phosphatase
VKRNTAFFVVIILATGASLLGGCAHHPRPRELSPNNIILLIGDGMGVSHMSAARIEAGSLNMERLPVGGLIATHAQGSLVTDSAASGTALATGRKTYNGAISVSHEGEPLKTVAEYAEERGMATGLTVTCSVTHATPAVFVAHVDDRSKEHEIARQIAKSGIDVLFGGGRSHFLPTTEPGGARKDGANLLEEMRGSMPVAVTIEEFRELRGVDRAAAFFAPDHPPVASRREPKLTLLTEVALNILSRDEDGFFLMVEGSQIDWAGHENKHEWLMDEMLDFDEAVGAAVDFAERDGRTLVVVTSDHETGAYAILDGSLERQEITHPQFGSGSHSACMVPILAYGPGSEAFGGIHDNTYVGRTLIGYVEHSRTPARTRNGR